MIGQDAKIGAKLRTRERLHTKKRHGAKTIVSAEFKGSRKEINKQENANFSQENKISKMLVKSVIAKTMEKHERNIQVRLKQKRLEIRCVSQNCTNIVQNRKLIEEDNNVT